MPTTTDRLLIRQRLREGADPTQPARRKLRAEGLIGRSSALARVLEEVARFAPVDNLSVLLTGPSGTGKTQLARLIHENSPRASRPFVELNCAALPEQLVESELFGALPGAFTNARRMEGKVAAAQGGTLFLDEVGELPPSSQTKLLKFLKSHKYYPLGGSELLRADVRVLSATNVDLKEAMARRAFREDLFYRLAGFDLRMPSLAERTEDIPELAEYFCARACEQHGFARLRLSVGALRAVQTAEWPGNIRELAHKIQAAVIRAAGEKISQVELHHLFPEVAEPSAQAEPLSFQEATRQFQKQHL